MASAIAARTDEASRRSAWAQFCAAGRVTPGIAALGDASREIRIRAGAALIEQGDRADTVYLIVEGGLKIVYFSENGHEIWLANVSVGELVGEVGALADIVRTSSIVALEDCRALALPSDAFRRILSQDAGISMAIAIMLARRLQSTTAQMSNLIAMPVTARLHGELVSIGTISPTDSEAIEIRDAPTVSALAERIHATREATSRAMTELEKRGLVHRSADIWTVITPCG